AAGAQEGSRWITPWEKGMEGLVEQTPGALTSGGLHIQGSHFGILGHRFPLLTGPLPGQQPARRLATLWATPPADGHLRADPTARRPAGGGVFTPGAATSGFPPAGRLSSR